VFYILENLNGKIKVQILLRVMKYGSSETCDFSIHNIAFMQGVRLFGATFSLIKYIFANLDLSVT